MERAKKRTTRKALNTDREVGLATCTRKRMKLANVEILDSTIQGNIQVVLFFLMPWMRSIEQKKVASPPINISMAFCPTCLIKWFVMASNSSVAVSCSTSVEL